MQAWLHHPYFVAAIAPFLVALISAEVLLRLRLSGLALIAGFAITVFLIASFDWPPLTLSQKIIWMALAASLLGILFSLLDWSLFNALLPLAASALGIWLLWPLLEHQPSVSIMIYAVSGAAFLTLLVWGMGNLSDEPLRAANATTALGIGTGIAVWGGSTLYGELALSMGCAAAAHLLIQMISNQPLATGRAFTLPASLALGVIACIALLAGHLSWYCFPLLAAIPLLAWMMPLPKMSVLLQGLLLSAITAPLAIAVVYLARHPL
ncbi:MAG: hypothetical protein RL358_945 [Pseudomonadota bacterium]|jgi:hypothetical protein